MTTSSRLTAPQRLRLEVVRLVGERTMLRLARWACPAEYRPIHEWQARLRLDALKHCMRKRADSDRKRRRLVARLWARRRTPRTIFGASLTGWWSNDPKDWKYGATPFALPRKPPLAICPPGAEYGPSGACVLQPNPSGREPHNTEETL